MILRQQDPNRNLNSQIYKNEILFTCNFGKDKAQEYLNELNTMIICYQNPRINFIKDFENFLFSNEKIECPALYAIYCFLFSNLQFKEKFNEGMERCQLLKMSFEFSEIDNFYLYSININICRYEDILLNKNFQEYLKHDLLLANIIKVYLIVKFGFCKKEKMRILFDILYCKERVSNIVDAFNRDCGDKIDYHYCLTLSFIGIEVEEYNVASLLCKSGLKKYPDSFYLIHNSIHILQMNSKWQESIFELEIQNNKDDLSIIKLLFSNTNNGLFIKTHLAWHLAIAYLERFKKENMDKISLNKNRDLDESFLSFDDVKDSLALFLKIVENFYFDTEYFVNVLGYCIWFLSIFKFKLCQRKFVNKYLNNSNHIIVEKCIKIAENFKETFTLNCTCDFLIIWLLSTTYLDNNESLISDINCHFINIFKNKDNMESNFFIGEAYPKFIKAFYYVGKNQISLAKLFIDPNFIPFFSGSEEQRQIYKIIA